MGREFGLAVSVFCASLAMGCVDSQVERCADGTICPSGKVCELTSATCVDPTSLFVSDGDVDLETLECGSTSQGFVSLRNLRSTPIQYSTRSTMSIVTLEPAEGTIPAGGSVDVRVLADASETELAVGRVEGAISFITDTQSISRVVSFEVSGALLRVSDSTLDYGVSSLADLSDARVVTLSNSGNLAMDVDLSGVDVPFLMQGERFFRLEGGESRDVMVDYVPETIGEFSSQIDISVSGPLCVGPQAFVGLRGEVSDSPILVSTSLVDFGRNACGVNAAAEKVFFVNNLPQAQTLQFSVEEIGAGVYQAPRELVLQPGESRPVDIVRRAVSAPQTPGLKSAKLSVTASPSGANLDLLLRHVIEAPFYSVSGNLDFGQVSDTNPRGS